MLGGNQGDMPPRWRTGAMFTFFTVPFTSLFTGACYLTCSASLHAERGSGNMPDPRVAALKPFFQGGAGFTGPVSARVAQVERTARTDTAAART